MCDAELRDGLWVTCQRNLPGHRLHRWVGEIDGQWIKVVWPWDENDQPGRAVAQLDGEDLS